MTTSQQENDLAHAMRRAGLWWALLLLLGSGGFAFGRDNGWWLRFTSAIPAILFSLLFAKRVHDIAGYGTEKAKALRNILFVGLVLNVCATVAVSGDTSNRAVTTGAFLRIAIAPAFFMIAIRLWQEAAGKELGITLASSKGTRRLLYLGLALSLGLGACLVVWNLATGGPELSVTRGMLSMDFSPASLLLAGPSALFYVATLLKTAAVTGDIRHLVEKDAAAKVATVNEATPTDV